MKIKPDPNTINHVLLVIKLAINEIDQQNDCDAQAKEVILRRLESQFTSYLFTPNLEVEV